MGDPIHQFQIFPLFHIGQIGPWSIDFTNSALFMVITVGLIIALLLGSTGSRALVPGRMQALAEMSYEFVAGTIRDNTGTEGMRFFPFVFSLFMFLLVSNLIGMLPGGFTVASQIIITVALALLVFGIVVVYGLYRNGLRFFKLFVPSGVPLLFLILVTPIEVMSFLSRPVSHSVRLFANMLAGHITIKVFGGFVVMLGAVGVAGWAGAVLPFVLIVALTALELLVAVLQAYVFAILTCIYLHDSIHPGH
jgi:F-type H+-transporting ATPase subunit a